MLHIFFRRNYPYTDHLEFAHLERIFGNAENVTDQDEMEDGKLIGRSRVGMVYIYADNGMTARRAIASALRSFCPDISEKENNKNNGQ
jgi:hypothetical protein